MDLYLIRHPQPLVAAEVYYGQTDLDTSAAAIAAAVTRVRPRLTQPIATWWCSPLQRCRKLAQALGVEARFDPRLMELDFGDLELVPWESVDPAPLAWWSDFVTQPVPGGESFRQLYDRVSAFLDELLVASVPEGLSGASSLGPTPTPSPSRSPVNALVRTVGPGTPNPDVPDCSVPAAPAAPADETAAPVLPSTVGIVTHGGVMRATLCRILGLPLAHAFRIALTYGGVLHVRLDADPQACQVIALS